MSTQAVQMVKSVAITPAMLKGTSVPEDTNPEYAAGTTYGLGVRVAVASVSKVYQSLQAGNLGKSPLTQTLWWKEVGPTNRWKPFDLSTSTQMVSLTDCYYEIAPGVACNAVVLLNMSGALSVRVRVIDPTFGLMHDTGVVSLITIPTESSWYAWFFGERKQQTQFMALDLPSYPNASIHVAVSGAPAIGVLMIGQLKTIGRGLKRGARVGIKDFSKKSRNEWGDLYLKQGEFAKKASFTIPIANDQLDNVYSLLASARGTPCLWIGYRPFACTIVYGFYNEFEVAIAYVNESDCVLDLEGLSEGLT